jgi:hypothetical protein
MQFIATPSMLEKKGAVPSHDRRAKSSITNAEILLLRSSFS